MEDRVRIADVILDPRTDDVLLVLERIGGDASAPLLRLIIDKAREGCTTPGGSEILRRRLKSAVAGCEVLIRDDMLVLQGVVIATGLGSPAIRLLDWWVCSSCQHVTSSAAARCAKCDVVGTAYRGAAVKIPAVRHQAVLEYLNDQLLTDRSRFEHAIDNDFDFILKLLNESLLRAGLPVVVAVLDKQSGKLVGFCPYKPPEPSA